MKGLCHKCWTSGVEVVIDFEITQDPHCLQCYEKRSKTKIKRYHDLLKKLPPRKDINVDAMVTVMKGRTDE